MQLSGASSFYLFLPGDDADGIERPLNSQRTRRS